MHGEFFQNLKIQAVNSLFVNLNDLIMTSFFLSLNTNLYRIDGKEYYEQERFVQYHSFAYSSFWSVLHTFGCLMEIYIVTERIKILHKSTKYKKYSVILKHLLIINQKFNFCCCCLDLLSDNFHDAFCNYCQCAFESIQENRRNQFEYKSSRKQDSLLLRFLF